MLKRRRGARRQSPSPETRGEALSSLSLVGEELDDEVDLVERTVRDFRGQRLSMVQNLRQFVLCYESVLEWLAT
jgi:protein-tyrosine phosphatase